ncbi:MAG: hypothetical protein QM809_10375 [Gordonia sp. (in: high G+C Gram-positive bacteria)]|uniref:hypothetical protein n=1 Tax=Gordonia sp. (in: high G+C Gram-positive bacteria) TaxID=84139 RepID=UPI0039E5E4B1
MRSAQAVVYGALGLFLAISVGFLAGGVLAALDTVRNDGDWLLPGAFLLVGVGFLIQTVRFGASMLRDTTEPDVPEDPHESVRRNGTRLVATVDRVTRTSRGWELLAIHTDPETGRKRRFVHGYRSVPRNAPAVGTTIGVRYDPADPSVYIVEVD